MLSCLETSAMRVAERFLFFAAILALSLGLWAGAVAKASPQPEGYSTSVNIVPGKEKGSYLFSARVTRLENGKTVARGEVTAFPGTPAQVDATDDASGTRVIFNAEIEKGAASYSFDLEKGGRRVGKHVGSIHLM
jgi:hypothetical protein